MTLKQIIDEETKKFVEKGADLEHDRWARWQQYMFSKMYEVKGIGGEPTGEMILPKEFVDRWFRQINTKYSDLSEEEKESDRKETRNYLPLLESSLSRIAHKTLEAVKGIKKSPYESRICQNRNMIDYCCTCEQAWDDCSCPARNTGFNSAIEQFEVKVGEFLGEK